MNPDTKNGTSDHAATTEGERRAATRTKLTSQVTLRVRDAELQGSAENLSRSGVLFFTEGTLRVTVQIEDDGVVRERTGKLIRSERIRGEQQGWAVEFDAA